MSSRRSYEQPDDEMVRIAYRRALALSHLADNPGASRARIAAAAGLEDRHASSLLADLHEAGLAVCISILGDGAEHDAWRLTPRGMRMVGRSGLADVGAAGI